MLSNIIKCHVIEHDELPCIEQDEVPAKTVVIKIIVIKIILPFASQW